MDGQQELFEQEVAGVDLAIVNADDRWRAMAMRGLQHLADTRRPFTAYDIVELGVPEPDHANRWGGLFHAAHAAGTIKSCGYIQSRRPGRSGGSCHLWVGGAA